MRVHQGEMVNNIEKNVSCAVDYVGEAQVATKKAVRYQKQARRVRLLPSFPSLFRTTSSAGDDPKPSVA